MQYDYSVLFESEDGITNTWRELYDFDELLSHNLLNLLRRSVYLPHDFYDIIAAYCLLPSALCKNIPYLFLTGRSGSGKSTIGKLASYLHGVKINSSSDTFAGIRNELDKNRKGIVDRVDPDEPEKTYRVAAERNTCMVWDDVDPNVFISSPDLYRMFKFGSNKASSTIILSSKDIGENLEFSTFCPKIFSSISPIHLDDRFKELKRRLIVIPFKLFEELTDERKAELGVTSDNWQAKLIDLDAYDWKGFSDEFQSFWDLDTARSFITARKTLGKTAKGFTSLQRSISLDLLASGIASGVWQDEVTAMVRLKNYWEWFDYEGQSSSNVGILLKEYIAAEQQNAKQAGVPLRLHVNAIKNLIDGWVETGCLLELPRTFEIKTAMFDLGFKLNRGVWSKD